MQFKSRKDTLHAAIEDWRARGLVDAATAATLHRDTGAQRARIGFMGFLVLAGVISLCFGVMTFVATNWDVIPRPVRLLMILAALWGAWIGAVVAARRGYPFVSHALVLLACGVFGAGIMLVAQLYHIQGDPHDAVFLWFLGTALAVALTRSVPALILAFLLLGLWGVTTDTMSLSRGELNLFFLPLWAICSLGAWALRSRPAGHVAAFVMLGWLLYVLTLKGDSTALVYLSFCAGWGLISIALVSLAKGPWLHGFEAEAILYVLMFLSVLSVFFYFSLPGGAAGDALRVLGREAPVLFWGALIAMPGLALSLGWAVRRAPERYDIWVGGAFSVVWVGALWALGSGPVVAVLMMASSVWIVRMGWRLEARAMRILGFAGFAASMLLIYADTLGSLISTSLFYIGAGVLLLIGAYVAIRLKPGDPEPGTDGEAQ